MAKIFGPRKRRTRQHVIADQSANHVMGLVFDAAFTAEPKMRDYGYDVEMKTYDEEGYIEPGLVYFQIKASDKLKEVGNAYVFDLDIRDYNLWIREQTLVVLVLYHAIHRSAYWLDVKQFFLENETRRPAKGAKWVPVRIPKNQRLTPSTMAEFRRRKTIPADLLNEDDHVS